MILCKKSTKYRINIELVSNQIAIKNTFIKLNCLFSKIIKNRVKGIRNQRIWLKQKNKVKRTTRQSMIWINLNRKTKKVIKLTSYQEKHSKEMTQEILQLLICCHYEICVQMIPSPIKILKIENLIKVTKNTICQGVSFQHKKKQTKA